MYVYNIYLSAGLSGVPVSEVGTRHRQQPSQTGHDLLVTVYNV